MMRGGMDLIEIPGDHGDLIHNPISYRDGSIERGKPEALRETNESSAALVLLLAKFG